LCFFLVFSLCVCCFCCFFIPASSVDFNWLLRSAHK
jgi:hypothetical protein